MFSACTCISSFNISWDPVIVFKWTSYTLQSLLVSLPLYHIDLTGFHSFQIDIVLYTVCCFLFPFHSVPLFPSFIFHLAFPLFYSYMLSNRPTMSSICFLKFWCKLFSAGPPWKRWESFFPLSLSETMSKERSLKRPGLFQNIQDGSTLRLIRKIIITFRYRTFAKIIPSSCKSPFASKFITID